jgi:hypothetical protein
MDPFLDNIRGENKFNALMQKTMERWESFEI